VSSPRTSSGRWIRFWAVLNGALVFVLIGGALFGKEGVVRHERLAEELRRVRELNSDLDRENARLRKEVEALRHDASYVEQVIRDELGFVRADEMVILIPEVSP
jgi:cell division protein FtsB